MRVAHCYITLLGARLPSGIKGVDDLGKFKREIPKIIGLSLSPPMNSGYIALDLAAGFLH